MAIRNVCSGALGRGVVSLESEAILAAIGLPGVLKSRPRFGQEQQADAAALPMRIRRDLLRFMSGAADPVSKLPEFDYDEVRDLLDAGDETNTERTHALYQLLPPDLAEEVEADAARIVGALQGVLPRQVYKSVAKVHSDPPEPYALGRFRRAWEVAKDPRSVLRDLLEDQIGPGDVEALKLFWPEIYSMLMAQVDEAISTMKSRRGENWDLGAGHDRALKALIGAPTIDMTMAQDYAKYAAPLSLLPPPRSAAQAVKTGDLKEAEQLPGQTA